MKKLLVAFLLFLLLPISLPVWAKIPATPVMTLYRFNGDLDIPYYDANAFLQKGASSPAGTLAQGTSVIPCLVTKNGRPLTDNKGTPYVGFRIIVDARSATPAATEKFRNAYKQQEAKLVNNHHCGKNTRHVLNVRNLYDLEKAPFFDPPARIKQSIKPVPGRLDQIIRTFHNSPQCAKANQNLTRRRSALQQAWDRFIRENRKQWSNSLLSQARHLDYTMRTAIFESHLDRGCNAYGACERNIIALSIRNRGKESCKKHYGCRSTGDFQSVSSTVSQYNIWDEYLTQISGLTSCFLRTDLDSAYYAKLQRMYEQSIAQVQRILYGNNKDLGEIFPKVSLTDLKNLRHYYHPPAMGKCFPNHDRVEYISGAIARKGADFALIANARIHADRRAGAGYLFRDFVFSAKADRDEIKLIDNYPGFIIDGRKVLLKSAARCYPYGVPRGCGFKTVGRYRKTPSWLSAGKPLALTCRVKDQGKTCQETGAWQTAQVGGVCDVEMKPVAGVN